MFTNHEIYAICHLLIKKGEHGCTEPILEYFINNTISPYDRQRFEGTTNGIPNKMRELVTSDKYNVEIKITKNRRHGK